jgi:hypothetical protein
MLTESPPSSQRLVIAIPAVALLVAVGLEQTVRLVWRVVGPFDGLRTGSFDGLRTGSFGKLRMGWGSSGREGQNVVLALLVLVMALGSLRFYFLEYTPQRRYGNRNGETATMMGRYLRDLEGESQVYLFGAPQIYWSFGTMTFLAPGVSGQDVVEPLDSVPDLQAEGSRTLFLFLPRRVGELEWVQQAFPDGRLREFRDADHTLRFTAYEVVE